GFPAGLGNGRECRWFRERAFSSPPRDHFSHALNLEFGVATRDAREFNLLGQFKPFATGLVLLLAESVQFGLQRFDLLGSRFGLGGIFRRLVTHLLIIGGLLGGLLFRLLALFSIAFFLALARVFA